MEGRKKRAKKKQRADASRSSITVWPIYVMVIVALVLYVLLQRIRIFAITLGIVTFFLIIIAIVLELISGKNEVGYKKSILEIAAAIIIVVFNDTFNMVNQKFKGMYKSIFPQNDGSIVLENPRDTFNSGAGV